MSTTQLRRVNAESFAHYRPGLIALLLEHFLELFEFLRNEVAIEFCVLVVGIKFQGAVVIGDGLFPMRSSVSRVFGLFAQPILGVAKVVVRPLKKLRIGRERGLKQFIRGSSQIAGTICSRPGIETQARVFRVTLQHSLVFALGFLESTGFIRLQRIVCGGAPG